MALLVEQPFPDSLEPALDSEVSQRSVDQPREQRVVELRRGQLEVDQVDPLDWVDPFLLDEGLYLLTLDRSVFLQQNGVVFLRSFDFFPCL